MPDELRSRTPSHGLCLSLTFLVCLGPLAHAQSAEVYTIPVKVYEVDLTFTATNFQGIPIEDLNVADLRLLDRGKQQERIVRFEHHQGMALRAGIVVDASRSMLGDSLQQNEAVAKKFAESILRASSDQAFVTEFDFAETPIQSWTNDTKALESAIGKIGKDAGSRLGGTALWDSLYRAIRGQFGTLQGSMSTGNVVLLFSDGDDNVSHAYLRDVVDLCQETHTIIYAFTPAKKSRFNQGEKNLAGVTSQTGGQLFYFDESFDIARTLQAIESNMRNSYRVVYRPSNIRRDGKFHSIKLTSPTRGGQITGRSGYYAPSR